MLNYLKEDENKLVSVHNAPTYITMLKNIRPSGDRV